MESNDISKVGLMMWLFWPEIKMARLDERAIVPVRKHWDDAGLDFCALHDTLIPSMEYKTVGTGITVEMPSGFFGLLKPKGGNNHLVGAGVVDQGYQGEIMFKIFNPTKDTMSFSAGQPIGQMVLIPVIRPTPVEVSLDEVHKEMTERANTGGILEDVEQV